MEGDRSLEELERTLSTELAGTPELKAEEKRYNLGEFLERVILSLTKDEVRLPDISKDTERAFQNPQACTVIVAGDIVFKDYLKYKKLSDRYGLKFTVRSGPDYQGNLGLIIVSDRALE